MLVSVLKEFSPHKPQNNNPTPVYIREGAHISYNESRFFDDLLDGKMNNVYVRFWLTKVCNCEIYKFWSTRKIFAGVCDSDTV